MNELTQAIVKIKEEVSEQEWQKRIIDCQNSRMNVRTWCSENGIKPSTYYFHLRRIRESVLEENRIIPVEKPQTIPSSEIRVTSGNITITLTEHVSPEQLKAVLLALKSC